MALPLLWSFFFSLCCSFPVYVTAMISHIDYASLDASLGASDGLSWDCYYPTIQRRFTKEGATQANLSLYSSSKYSLMSFLQFP